MNFVEYMGLMPGDRLVATKFYKEGGAYYVPEPDGSDKRAIFLSRDKNDSTIKVQTTDGVTHTYSIDHWKPEKKLPHFVEKIRAIVNVIREDRSTDWGER